MTTWGSGGTGMLPGSGIWVADAVDAAVSRDRLTARNTVRGLTVGRLVMPPASCGSRLRTWLGTPVWTWHTGGPEDRLDRGGLGLETAWKSGASGADLRILALKVGDCGVRDDAGCG